MSDDTQMSKQSTFLVKTYSWLLLLILLLSFHILLVSTARISNGENQKRLDKGLQVRRKRNVAEAIVQDSVSRGHAKHRRRSLLQEMLKVVDTSMGGGCQCLSSKGDKSGCVCDINSLISTLYTILSSPGNKHSVDAKLKAVIAKLHPNDLRAMHAVLRQRLVRMRHRTNQMLRQRLRARRHRIMQRHNPRSVFDGKQFFMF